MRKVQNHKLITVAGCLKLKQVGTMVRTLASHQCGLGSNPGIDPICGLSLLLVLSFAPRGFSLGTPVFPSPQKRTLLNSNLTRNQADEEPLILDVLPLKSLVSFPSTDRPFPCLQRQSDIQVSKNLPEIADSSPEPRRAVLLGIPVQ